MKSVLKLIVFTLFMAVAANVYADETAMSATPTARKLAFAWGAETGGNIDLSGHNMSSVDINVKFGIRWRWIRFAGVGAEGDIMVTNSGRIFPIFANFRTDFCNTEQLFFADIRGGVALNYLYENQNTGAYFSAGGGITLARSNSFSSHIILAYSYYGIHRCMMGNTERRCPGLSEVALRLGIAF